MMLIWLVLIMAGVAFVGLRVRLRGDDPQSYIVGGGLFAAGAAVLMASGLQNARRAVAQLRLPSVRVMVSWTEIQRFATKQPEPSGVGDVLLRRQTGAAIVWETTRAAVVWPSQWGRQQEHRLELLPDVRIRLYAAGRRVGGVELLTDGNVVSFRGYGRLPDALLSGPWRPTA